MHVVRVHQWFNTAILGIAITLLSDAPSISVAGVGISIVAVYGVYSERKAATEVGPA